MPPRRSIIAGAGGHWLMAAATAILLARPPPAANADFAREAADDEGALVLEHKDQRAEVDASDEDKLSTFCFLGEDPRLTDFWKSVAFRLEHESGDDYSLLLGPNATAVEESWEETRSGFVGRLLRTPWRTESVRVSPFAKTCLGVVSASRFNVTLHVDGINFWQVLMTGVGLATFFYAPTLCRNVFFHYSTGVATGILFSLLIVTFYVQKRLRTGWISWILGFYSISLYLMTSLWYNLKAYLMNNQSIVFGYLIVTGIISFAGCYRLGPVENPRTMNLIQWALQSMALVLIYASSYYVEASTAVAIVAVGWTAIPDAWKTKAQAQYRHCSYRGAQKIRLLNEQEYMDQSRAETKRALEELRNFCQSPKCNPWKTVSRLSSPNRFADFIQGSSHLTQDEVVDYSSADFTPDNSRNMTDDDDDAASDSDELNRTNEDRDAL